MQLSYPRLRYGLLAAAALFAFPAVAQVDLQAEPSSEAYREAITNPRTPASNAARRAAATPSKDGPLRSLDGTLRDLAQDYEARATRGARAADEYVRIDALATSRADTRKLAAALARLGFEQTSTAGIMVSGRLPVRSIKALASIPSLRSAMAPHYLVHGRGADSYASPVLSGGSFVGAVTAQSNEALRADLARDRFGVDGSGVCIGMMSDSYNNLGGAAGDMASGDLPSDIQVLDDLAAGGADEGRAMMQLAYDVAPGTDFAFHTAFEGYASFAGGVVDLFRAGCNVVVDDIGTSFDPFFQDGAIAQAIDYIVSEGATYFSSAGNAANASYEGDYRDSGIPGPFGGPLHDFDPGPGVDAFQNVVVPSGGVLRFTFQYDEPSVLAGVEVSEYPDLYGGAAGQSPESDYDVFVLAGPSSDADFLDISINSNPIFGAPVEFIEYVNESAEAVTVYVAIEQFSGVPRRLKYINFGGTRPVIQNAEYNGASTVFGHSNAEGTFATGAAPFFNTPAFNPAIRDNPTLVGGAAVEPFTSFGGLDILLDIDGNRLDAPDERMKPDAVASDGDNNTFFGFDTTQDPDAFPNFFGTSAAAPNASGVAALMMEATDGMASPADIYGALEGTADDILRGPGSFNFGSAPGFDDQSGFGFIRADFALEALVPDEPPIACSPEAPLFFADFDTDGDDPTFGEFASIGNDGPDGAAVDLSTCSFAAFNPFTERVTYALSLDDVVAAESEFVLATMNGDVAIPSGSIPDGPGAIVLAEGEVAVGASVQDVLGRVVASVVYFNEDRIVGSRRGGPAAVARTATDRDQAFLDALDRVRTAALDAPVDLTLTAAPNPVQGRLAVAFGTEELAPVRASVYDALGREVAVLADRSFEAGRHEVALDMAAMPSGVYIVRVIVGDDVQTKQVTVVR